MNKSLQEQLSEIAPSLRLKVKKAVDFGKAKTNRPRYKAKTIECLSLNEKRFEALIELVQCGRKGEQRKVHHNTDISAFLDLIKECRIEGKISVIDEFFCLCAVGNVEEYNPEKIDNFRKRLCDTDSEINELINNKSTELKEEDLKAYLGCAHIIKSHREKLREQQVLKELGSYVSLARKVLALGNIDAKISSTPILDQDDVNLSMKWLKPGIIHTQNQIDNIIESLINEFGKDYELGRVLSARAAEKAAKSFYESCNCTVEDVSLLQINQCNDTRWKDYDLKVNDRPIDVKNSRRSKSSPERYVEHCVPKFKITRRDESVVIAGVLSQYLWPESLLAPKDCHCNTELLFLGETTYDKHSKLTKEFINEYFDIDFGRPDHSANYFLPPWVFDYPSLLYKKRDDTIAELSEHTVPDLNLCRQKNINPIPICIVANIDLSKHWPEDTLKSWKWQFINRLSMRVNMYGLSLPFLYLSLLGHFLEMVCDQSAQSEDYQPEQYRGFVFMGSEMDDRPLGIYDPLYTISGLINTLTILWRAEHGLIKKYKYFKLSGFHILQGKKTVNVQWETLVAYCGGRNKSNNTKCGNYPLVLGESAHCKHCGKLICPDSDCGFCSSNCQGMGAGIMDQEERHVIIEKVKIFWKPEDELICTRIFKRSANKCYLCGQTPMENHHVLLNSTADEIIDLDFKCVIRLKKVMEYLGSRKKILFFSKNKEEAAFINTKHSGTAEVVQFISNYQDIEKLLSNPNELKYEALRSILDFTSKFKAVNDQCLFHKALDIYVARKYYIYDATKDFKKGDDVEKIIEHYLIEQSDEYMADDEYEKLTIYAEEFEDSFSMDDLAPEGLGSDEIDWDSHN